MNIKSLLMGSVAAFVVVSGAQAADAVVAAAPEPMEYVKVCDAFGTGYFYIPGTETCLNISAEVRYEMDWKSTGASKWSSYSGSLYRLHVNAKNDSEYGTVYSFIRVEGHAAASATATDTKILDTGMYVGIGGFEAGYFDNYWTRFFDYGGFTYDGGRTNFMSNAYAAYNGTAGNISYMASVDDLQNTTGSTYGLNAAVKGTFGDMGAGLGIAYDGAAKSAALKAYVSAKVDMFTLKLMGVYADKTGNAYAQSIKGFTLIAAGKADLTDNLFVAIDYSYSFVPKTSYVVGDIGWHVASGFDVLAEGTYDSGTKDKGAFLRLSRTF